MDFYSNRRANLLRAVKPLGVEAVLVTHEPNVRYLTGFAGGSSFVLISSKQATLISDDRFAEQLKEEFPTLDAHVRPHHKSTPQATAELIVKAGYKSVGVEGDHIALNELEYYKTECPKVAFSSFPNEIEKLRAIKDPMEVEQIRTAIKAAERAFHMFKATLRDQDTEKDMADNLEKYIRRAGAFCAPFPVIVAVGDRGALPHAVPGLRTLGEASKVLVDFGADCGYKCDLTRTLKSPFGVNPNRKNKMERTGHSLEEIHGVVVAAQEAAAATLRAGVPAKDVDAAARKVIQKAGFEDFFNHGLGHGLGLEYHELPRVRQNSEDVLEAGMVITLEPGIYLPGWGGVRMEDDYLVTREGCLPLTTLSKDINFLAQ